MPKPKLTPWLIFFIIWILCTSAGGFQILQEAEKTWRPFMAANPSMRNAVRAFQFFTGAGIITWIYAAWLVFKREPGTLRTIRKSLLIGAGLRIFGGWTLVLLGRLPSEMRTRFFPQLTLMTSLLFFVTAAWYLYLLRSQKIRDIYPEKD
jgi:hypothetical protein